MKTYRGLIEGFGGTWGSGIGYLFVSGRTVACDNADTARQLDSAFGNVITRDHLVDNRPIIGKDIAYSTEGPLLRGFTPYEHWLDAGRPEIPLGGCIDVVQDENGDFVQGEEDEPDPMPDEGQDEPWFDNPQEGRP